MAGAPCKAAQCQIMAAAVADQTTKLVNDQICTNTKTFSDMQLDQMIECAEKFIHDMNLIIE